MTNMTITFKSAAKAVEYATKIQRQQINQIAAGFKGYIANDDMPLQKTQGFYPLVSVEATKTMPPRSIRPYGFLPQTGDAVYEGTFTSQGGMDKYFAEQLALIKETHGDSVTIKVGLSNVPIPIDYTGILDNPENYIGITAEKEEQQGLYFDMPNDRFMPVPDIDESDLDHPKYPLAWYTAPQMDKSLARIRYYTGTAARFFQPFTVFTNYDTYMGLFDNYGRELFEAEDDNPVIAIVKPGNQIEWNPRFKNANVGFIGYKTEELPRGPQMPAYHIIRKNGRGTSLVNIGVGPSNAANITDHLAVLRPEAWLMLGHCAGLQSTQRLGDFVIPNGYVLEDGLMEKKIQGHHDVTDIAEIQKALTNSIKDLSGNDPDEYKHRSRTGIVKTVADRNWEDPETRSLGKQLRKEFGRNNAIGLDMESGTIAANGFWHRVPHGALLCVSDLPLHGIIKRKGGPLEQFYKQRVSEHFQVAMDAIDKLREMPEGELHSRKLYSTHACTPFR